MTDDALGGSDTGSTARVLAAAVRDLEYDLLLAGADTSDGGAGVVPAGVATLLGLPYLSYAAKIEPDPAAGRVRVHRISPTGFDVLEAPMPALVVGDPGARRAALPVAQGDHGRAVEDDRDQGARRPRHSTATVGGAVATTAVVGSEAPPPRAATRVVRAPADEAAREVVDFLAERRII